MTRRYHVEIVETARYVVPFFAEDDDSAKAEAERIEMDADMDPAKHLEAVTDREVTAVYCGVSPTKRRRIA